MSDDTIEGSTNDNVVSFPEFSRDVLTGGQKQGTAPPPPIEQIEQYKENHDTCVRKLRELADAMERGEDGLWHGFAIVHIDVADPSIAYIYHNMTWGDILKAGNLLMVTSNKKMFGGV